jgi:class 3 adenylate cyclase
MAGSLAWLGGLTAMAGRSLWRERQERQTLMRLFSRHVSAPVAEEIWRKRAAFMEGGRPRPQQLTATVLFSDIEGFTPVAERLAPDALIAWLELYLERMVAIVAEERGLVLRFIGDAVLAAYGVPVARTREAEITADAQAAARTALRMVAAVEALNGELSTRGLPAIGIRIGIHTGPLVAGSVGGATHLEYSLVGDTANTAARLETLGKQHRGGRCGTILVGEPTAARLGKTFQIQLVGEMALKGKTHRVEVYELLAEPSGRGPVENNALVQQGAIAHS